MPLDPTNFNAARFRIEDQTTIPILLQPAFEELAQKTAQAFKEIARYINRLDGSFVAVGEGGYVTRKFPAIPTEVKDGRTLVRTFTDEQMIEGEGDWELAVGSEIP